MTNDTPSIMKTERKSAARSLHFFNNDNEFSSGHLRERQIGQLNLIDEIVVWGGCVANCGEDQLSNLVDNHAKGLRSIVYMPHRTKGGLLIRPKYYRGDRAGRQVFPNLERMAIQLTPALHPFEYGWDTPALCELTLLIDTSTWTSAREPSARDYVKRALRNVVALHDEGSYVRKLHAKCPQLDRVNLEVCRRDDEQRTRVRLLSVLTPKDHVPWGVLRLLKLVETKPDTGIIDESVERCHSALRQVMPLLWPLVARPPWSVTFDSMSTPLTAVATSKREEATAVLGVSSGPSLHGKRTGSAGINRQLAPHERWLEQLRKLLSRQVSTSCVTETEDPTGIADKQADELVCGLYEWLDSAGHQSSLLRARARCTGRPSPRLFGN